MENSGDVQSEVVCGLPAVVIFCLPGIHPYLEAVNGYTLVAYCYPVAQK